MMRRAINKKRGPTQNGSNGTDKSRKNKNSRRKGNLQLPISSLVEEFKIGKVRLHMMMKDSADEIIRKAYPEIKSGINQEAECSLRIKDIIGVMKLAVFSKVGAKGKRDMVTEEVRMFEEEQTQAKR